MIENARFLRLYDTYLLIYAIDLFRELLTADVLHELTDFNESFFNAVQFNYKLSAIRSNWERRPFRAFPVALYAVSRC